MRWRAAGELSTICLKGPLTSSLITSSKSGAAAQNSTRDIEEVAEFTSFRARAAGTEVRKAHGKDRRVADATVLLMSPPSTEPMFHCPG